MKRSCKRYMAAMGVVLVAALLAGRLYLNVWLKEYVNHVLGDIEGYGGSVADIDIALYRGAYRVHKLAIFKKNGNIPVPFIDMETVDLSVQWGALFHGRVVSNVDIFKPVINFAVSKSGAAEQTGAGVDWTKLIKDLMPIDINLVTFREGTLAYRDFSTTPQVNVYIRDMSGQARNLRNVVDTQDALPSIIVAEGNSIGGGRLDLSGRMNILKPIPDMALAIQLEKVHLPALNNYTKAYAGIDVEEGNVNIYSEFNVRDGRVSGYIKPIATHISLIDLRKEANPVKLVWEAAVSVVLEIFTNQRKDQFATKIPLEGNVNNVDTDTWSAIYGIIRNAFIRALNNGLDRDVKTLGIKRRLSEE